MTQRSFPWASGAGDGGPYSADALRWTYGMLAGGSEGVVRGHGDELEVSSSGNNNVTIGTGRAIVDGTLYESDASVPITTASPSGGTTGRLVVLRKTWSTREVRVAVRSSADGTATIPSPTQSDGDTWEVPLASFTITTGGVIGSLTDLREFLNTWSALYPAHNGPRPHLWACVGSGSITQVGTTPPANCGAATRVLLSTRTPPTVSIDGHVGAMLTGTDGSDDMTDLNDVEAYASFSLPVDASRLIRADVLTVPGATGTFTREITAAAGAVGGDADAESGTTGSISNSQTAGTIVADSIRSILVGDDLSRGDVVSVTVDRTDSTGEAHVVLGVLLEWA